MKKHMFLILIICISCFISSQEVIMNSLQDLFPEIPIISEESSQVSFQDRREWSYFWLVDPLDGTKEFINRNGEFTINIGLVMQDLFMPA